MKLNEKQKEFQRVAKSHKYRWNFKEGAVRSGKTYFDLIYTLPYRIMNAPTEGTIMLIGNTLGTLEQNILDPMRTYFNDPKGTLVGYVKPNGYVRLFGRNCKAYGADKKDTVKKIHGSSVSYCYGDEVATWSEEVFTELKARLSVKGACFDGTCNPEYPNHWLLKFLNSDANIFRQKYLLSDNREFLTEDYYEDIQKEYAGTVFYDRYILGEWALAEGRIYSNYDPKRDSIEYVPEPLTGLRYVSVDYGTQNACVYLMWEEGKSGTWYLTDEYYYSGRDSHIQKTDAEYVIDFNNFTRDRPEKATVVDPSAASFITALRKVGHKVKKARNDVLDGIRLTATYLSTGKIKILKNCTHTLDEIGSYSWDSKKTEDVPLKEDDHCMDAMRYFVYTILRRNRKRKVTFLT